MSQNENIHHADEVDSQEHLACGLQGPAARLLSVHLPRPAGQNQEASDDGQRPGIHSHLWRGGGRGQHSSTLPTTGAPDLIFSSYWTQICLIETLSSLSEAYECMNALEIL